MKPKNKYQQPIEVRTFYFTDENMLDKVVIALAAVELSGTFWFRYLFVMVDLLKSATIKKYDATAAIVCRRH